jgi:ectoine hydroxylase-related dioxygenase (phytanoyl-CoA dioxygenase family)
MTSTLPDLTSPYAVQPFERQAYVRDGHIVLRGVASPSEVAAYGDAIARAATGLSTETRPLEARDVYGRAFLQTMNLWRVDESVASFVLCRRFAGIAAQLLGVDRVRLYHDQALFKEPSGGHTPWHQDAGYWPLDGERCITMWLPLQDVSPAMGSLQFASGTNAVGSLADLTISDESDDFFETLAGRDFPVTEPATLAVGDASFHGGWTLHRALANTTDRMRAVMTVIWFADGLRVDGSPGPIAVNDLATWLPGCRPGDLAASELNPVLG